MNPLIEVVICTFNRAFELDRCLERLAKQRCSAQGWTVTVVDNNCTDHTAEVVAAHLTAGRIPGLRRVVESTQGLTPARQRGALGAAAPWIAFVDDDCMVAEDWVAATVDFASRHPGAAGFGGVVTPALGRSPPRHVSAHGWLFAEQELGDLEHPVDSLVGAGIVVSRQALIHSGWTDTPYLADRTGLGYASGGDVEICFRLRTTGRELWYVPSMCIEHLVSADRQRMRGLMGLAQGLGAGEELINLMGSVDPDEWLVRAQKSLDIEVRKHWKSTPYVLRGRYSWRDWLIRAAFLHGRRLQQRALAHDGAKRKHLAGVWSQLKPPTGRG